MTSKVYSLQEVQGWFVGRMPDAWFIEVPELRADREEIVVTGLLATPDLGADPEADQVEVACRARIAAWREETREQRMRIADEAELRWGRKVSWGARCGEVDQRFTSQSVAAMTRLRFDERAVLDTLIDAGVARSRSEALNWCVRLVSRHQQEWIDQLREAMARVEDVRAGGPDVG